MPPPPPRYENVERIAAKYWEIEIEGGTTITMKSGRMDGTLKDIGEPSITTKKYKTAEEAKWKYEELVANKIDKGYQLVQNEKDIQTEEEAADAAVPKVSNEALEKAIYANPDTPDAYLVYGDWLQAQGDPRGELIALQAALAKKKNSALAKKEKELIAKHDTRWLGATLSAFSVEELTCEWRYGFLRKVRFGGSEDSLSTEAYAGLMKTSSLKFLEELEVNAVQMEDDTSYSRVIDEMASCGVPNTLRRLVFDVCDYQISWTELGDLSKIYAKLLNLRELKLQVGKMTLGDRMDLPSLERLEIVTTSLSKANVAAIASASWPRLETLSLYFGTPQHGCDCSIEDVIPLLNRKLLPKVRHLGLRNSIFEDDLAREVMRSNLLPQLETLNLSDGIMTDRGIEAILSQVTALGNLKSLIIRHGYVGEAMITRLRDALGARVQMRDQESPIDVDDEDDDEEDYRYVSLSE